MDKLQLIKDKILPIEELTRTVKRWQLKDEVVVFTNGCFDLLHVGHMEVISKAASIGDKVIVGLNSDDSVKRLKGENRPINNTEERAFALAALHHVDAVIVFEEDTPANLIELVAPDVLVKGGDWTEDKIVGAEFVKSNGGQVVSIELTEGYSSTDLINRIVKAN